MNNNLKSTLKLSLLVSTTYVYMKYFAFYNNFVLPNRLSNEVITDFSKKFDNKKSVFETYDFCGEYSQLISSLNYLQKFYKSNVKDLENEKFNVFFENFYKTKENNRHFENILKNYEAELKKFCF